MSPASKKSEIVEEDTLHTEKHNKSFLTLLTDRTARFISGKEIRINLSKSNTDSISRAIEEGRGKMKKLNPIILVVGALVTLIVSLMIGGVSLISAKALVIGKVAFVSSLILLLNGFFMGGTNMLPTYKHGIPTPTNYGVNYPNNYPYSYGTNSLGGWNTQDKYPFARSFFHEHVTNK